MRGALTVLLRNGLFFADGHFWENLCVRLETGRVTVMGEGLAPLDGEAVIDLQGDFVLPGFVDAHIHAFRGHDTMQGEDAIRQMARELYREGIAAFLPTTMSGDCRRPPRDGYAGAARRAGAGGAYGSAVPIAGEGRGTAEGVFSASELGGIP